MPGQGARPSNASALFFHLDPLPLCCIGSPQGQHVMSHGCSAAGGGLRRVELCSKPPPRCRSRPCPQSPARAPPHPAGEARALAALPHAATAQRARTEPGRRGRLRRQDIVCSLPASPSSGRRSGSRSLPPISRGRPAGPCQRSARAMSRLPPATLLHCDGGPAGAGPRSAAQHGRSPLPAAPLSVSDMARPPAAAPRLSAFRAPLTALAEAWAGGGAVLSNPGEAPLLPLVPTPPRLPADGAESQGKASALGPALTAFPPRLRGCAAPPRPLPAAAQGSPGCGCSSKAVGRSAGRGAEGSPAQPQLRISRLLKQKTPHGDSYKKSTPSLVESDTLPHPCAAEKGSGVLLGTER